MNPLDVSVFTGYEAIHSVYMLNKAILQVKLHIACFPV